MAGNVVINGFKLEKPTKNKIRYNDFGDFGALYIPKEVFKGQEAPKEISIEVKWE